MKFLFSFAALCAFALLAIAVGNTAPEAEWPQWRGPLRNGLSSETGLLKQWPEKGPAVTWSIANLGEGYGSPAIKADRIYVQGTSGTASDAKSAVFCLNRADGKTIWSVTLGAKVDQDKKIAASAKAQSVTRTGCCICSAKNRWLGWPKPIPMLMSRKGASRLMTGGGIAGRTR